jgi:penicillin-binding protein 2
MFCNGSTTIHGHRRLCWKRGGHGWVDLRAALTHSCNVYFYHLGQRLGIERIHEYGSRFHLGQPSGIDLPGEAAGILPSPEWKEQQLRDPWYPGDTISVAIGQGLLAVTPIQMARMVAAVGGDGRIPHPHLVRGHGGAPESTGVSQRTLALVRDALRDAVALGTGRAADVPGIPVAGKTGTAQVYKHSAGVDPLALPKHERDHGWFVGYAPADDPQIAFAVVVEHGGHGGSSAAPIVRRALEAFFGTEPSADGTEELHARTTAPR